MAGFKRDRIKECCEKYMSQSYYHADKMNYFDIGMGCTERLVAVMGGYEEALIALVEEPEACREFMAELSRFNCRMFDAINKYFPPIWSCITTTGAQSVIPSSVNA